MNTHVAHVWWLICEARPQLPPILARDLHLLRPVALRDGVLTLRAPTRSLAERWARHGTEALAAACPVPLAGVVVVGPGTMG